MTDNKIREIRVIRENPRFRHYPEYKDSGVEWIGGIPKNWGMKRLKYIADLNMGQSPPSEEYNSDQIGTPFLQGNAEFGSHHPTPKIYCPTARKHANPSDILLSVRAPVGAINIANQEYGIGRGLCAIRPRTNQFERRYAKYLLEIVRAELHVVATGSTYEAVTADEVSNLTCVVPLLSEQQQIANFLDQKTEQIDELIRIKERRIELLQEQRTALINQAVTKGLDPNVKMKLSGVEWIGEIPRHWNAVPLTKYLESIIDYRGRTPEKIEDGRFLITAKNIRDGQIDYEISQEFTSENEYQRIMTRGIPQIGDVLFTTEAPLGEVANVDDVSIALAQRIIKFRPKPDFLNPYFLKYWILSYSFQYDLQRYATGSTAKGIKASKLCLLKLNLLPIKEQKQIVDYLDQKTQQIDELIATERRKIELLKEYRQSLISEAVTGKIDVRNEV